ncbi:MAG: hypothetical protein J5J06_07545 [Phycisphaerae bacterium]|nr:hypothetical protein [Phycisphaerae bacterium]
MSTVNWEDIEKEAVDAYRRERAAITAELEQLQRRLHDCEVGLKAKIDMIHTQKAKQNGTGRVRLVSASKCQLLTNVIKSFEGDQFTRAEAAQRYEEKYGNEVRIPSRVSLMNDLNALTRRGFIVVRSKGKGRRPTKYQEVMDPNDIADERLAKA